LAANSRISWVVCSSVRISPKFIIPAAGMKMIAA
jgi:hypothetical protein